MPTHASNSSANDWTTRLEIESVADSFERSLCDSKPQTVAGVLAAAPELPRHELLTVLLQTEIAHEKRTGQNPELSELLTRFPDDEATIVQVLEAELTRTKVISGTDSGCSSLNGEPEIVPGDLIGLYRLGRVIGSGANGVVYEAEDIDDAQTVALKILRKPANGQATLDAPENRAEAAVLSSLNHPCILPVYDYGETPHFIWFVIPKMHRTFRDLIKEGPVDPVRAAGLVAQVADALHMCHRNRIIHRDIKPSNLFLDQQGTPFVGDFGIALTLEHFGTGANYAGTPLYMSPEQAAGDSHVVDGRTDVFSLGVVMHMLLTKHHPFDFPNGTISEIAEHRRVQKLCPLQQLADVPAQLDAICRKALADDPDVRFSSADELATELLEFCNSPAVNVQEQSAPQFRKWTIRLVVLTVVAGAVAALLPDSEPDRTGTSGVTETGNNTHVDQRQPDLDTPNFAEHLKNMPYSDRERQAVTDSRERVQQLLEEIGREGKLNHVHLQALRYHSDPTDRSRLIRELSTTGISLMQLQQQIRDIADPGVLAALTLAHSHFDPDVKSLDRLIPLLTKKVQETRDPGLYSALIWLIRKAERPAATMPESGAWFSTCQGQLMMVLKGPQQFLMGSPEDEFGRTLKPHMEEPLHEAEIPYSFAVSTMEVTAHQFWLAKPLSKRGQEPPDDGRALNNCYWNTAAWYCNRLSELEGIPDGQHCYYSVGTTNGWLDFLPKRNISALQGYRMLTDEEWELVARAGTTTPRHFGYDLGLMADYANCSATRVAPVGERMPNDFGVFDMLGNVSEWLHGNEYFDSEGVKDRRHVRLRGGSAWTPLEGVRSAARYVVPKGNTSERLGFRIAKTVAFSD